MIESAIPVAYDGFAVGYPVPAGYPGYAVPPLYSDLYYPQQGFDYRYANGAIYQIDPQTQMVEAIAALFTGQTFGVGQALPAAMTHTTCRWLIAANITTRRTPCTGTPTAASMGSIRGPGSSRR